jgi:predicted lactoylglutathione lyase
MPKMIFVNLPVTDITRSTAFYEAVGASKNPMFSSDDTSCMVWSETIYTMIMTRERFATFTHRQIADAHTTVQGAFCLTAESRQEVDSTIEAAAKAGGLADPDPKQDHGFMYGRSYADPDGHIWEIVWMDPAAAANGPPETQA